MRRDEFDREGGGGGGDDSAGGGRREEARSDVSENDRQVLFSERREQL